MSERGMLLALQRLHDDPGFMGRICDDPSGTLGIYDIDDEEREKLIDACRNGDEGIIAQIARSYGVDWKAEHVTGIGALAEDEVSLEQRPSLGIEGGISPGALAGDGYRGVQS
ncbi:MAG: hypothetical protein M3437_10760 [Chloroflexota bacterium]|nr:hypothetical protein [Chloroflexota bacterium]MDQ5867447.1 hypothetical protein [Chloroflexota bacterium]